MLFLHYARYIYVSRLSIKLLEGGFDLKEHFHALRRYHFMEIADWADLFVTSLWHHVRLVFSFLPSIIRLINQHLFILCWHLIYYIFHIKQKWYFTEADQKIPEIQGLLESSIQRSSCERDHNKDRLYVYVKSQNRAPFPTTTLGNSPTSQSFGFVLSPQCFSNWIRIFHEWLVFVHQSLKSLTCALQGSIHLIL